MPRASFPLCALVGLWVFITAAQPGPIGWNLASPDHVFRLIRVAPATEKVPEPSLDWPAKKSRIQLPDGREACGSGKWIETRLPSPTVTKWKAWRSKPH